MRRMSRLLLLVAVGTVALLVSPAGSLAGHTTDPRTKNMQPLGHIVEPAVTGGFGGANPDIHTDIAFQGKLAFQGNWDGFNIRDISDPENPTTVSRTHCDGNQGDVVVYGNILVRAWNTGAGNPGAFGAGFTCDGETFPAGWEGVHVFDISNLADPQLVGWVELSGRCDDVPNPCRMGPPTQIDAFGCGSHTLTLAPDLAKDRLIVYNQTSGGPCPFVGILEVPLKSPGSVRWLRNEPLEHADAGHDSGVILGDVNLLATAAHDHTNVFSIGAPRGGSLTDPEFLYTIEEQGVCNVPASVDPNPERACNGNWHSAGFTWDGEVIVLGWEPGGGLQPECEAGDPPVKKSFFFYDADGPGDDGTAAGTKLGQWTLPRAQSGNENCTLHNYNLVPLRNGRDVLVSGNYQAGTWVVDITDPANAKTVGWSDPPAAPIPPGLGTPPAFCTNKGGCALTGAWASHWYNGFIYESLIGEGLNIFKLTGKTLARRIMLPRLNPQTQEFSLPN
jgi:LVIVD repeat